MEEKKITPTQLTEMIDKIKVAREDDTPCAVYGDGTLAVVGDANKTENKLIDVEVRFRFTKDELNSISEKLPEGAKTVGNYVVFTVVYEKLSLSPRQDAKMIEAMMDVMPLILDIEKILDAYKEKLREIESQYGFKYIEPNTKEEKLRTTATDENINAEMISLYNAYEKECWTEVFHVYAQAEDEACDALYRVVSIFLGIDKFHEDHMMAASVLGCMMSLIANYPELFNEVETVFIN